MSMLSAQCDELRRLASTLDTRYRYADDIATALRDAADTILSLRDRAQDLQADNAKLRELVRSMWFGLYCPTEPTEACPQCMFNKDGECFFERRMRNLGIEVD